MMGRNNDDVKKRADDVFIGTYLRYPAAMVSGRGSVLTDADGREYLDFLSGIAVCSLGHCHPAVTAAVKTQVERLVHVSNLYYTKPQTELAELLVANSFGDKVFMANSGAEVNEAAIKLARIAAAEGRHEILTLTGSFHGRTLASLAATGQAKFHQGFEPLPQGFRHVEFDDLAAIENSISPATCAIMCEPLQGEGGVRPLDPGYLKKIRALCDQHNLLLIFDEVQTGMGRTGTLFAYQQLGIVPDIMTLAKALGNGMPIGALVTTDTVAESFVPGTHGSTFGGNPVSAAAAVATLKVMLADGFLTGVQEKGDYLSRSLQDLADQFPDFITGVRGLGLLKGLVMSERGAERGADIVNGMFDRGYLINFAGNTALRFAPPLTVSVAEIDELVGALKDAAAEILQ